MSSTFRSSRTKIGRLGIGDSILNQSSPYRIFASLPALKSPASALDLSGS